MGIRLMKPVVHGRRPGSRNYTKEFREAVAAEANDPNRSIAEVARAHGLNAQYGRAVAKKLTRYATCIVGTKHRAATG
ncbi:transposase [Burkholderia sp. SIMBA_062]|uniref:transposase n=1 Tax=Burkholderia sp. SIMBA_062 TaxID=3085803 RepID=UPI0039790FCF